MVNHSVVLCRTRLFQKTISRKEMSYMQYRNLFCQLKRYWIKSFDPLYTLTSSFSLFVYLKETGRNVKKKFCMNYFSKFSLRELLLSRWGGKISRKENWIRSCLTRVGKGVIKVKMKPNNCRYSFSVKLKVDNVTGKNSHRNVDSAFRLKSIFRFYIDIKTKLNGYVTDDFKNVIMKQWLYLSSKCFMNIKSFVKS